MSDLFELLSQRLYDGDAPGVVDSTRSALDAGHPAMRILNEGLLAGMDRVGRDFRDGELFIPEVIVSARAMHAGLELLKPLLAAGSDDASHKIVIGTVQGDLHDIGKKLVGIMMQGAGFVVIDLGHDVSPDRFVQAVREHEPELLGLSALLSTTMPMMKNTMDALREAKLLDRVKVLVGGAPVNQTWADEIGAHGYAPDAVSAVDCARSLLQSTRSSR